MKPTILFSSFIGVLLLLAGVSYFFISRETKAGAIITDVSAINIIGPGAQIVWTTDIPSDSRVAYGDNTVLSLFSNSRCDAGGYVTAHCVNLTGLSPSTVYYYKVKSMDTTSVDSQLGGFQFTSVSGDSDIAAPSIPTGLAATAISSSQINLSWTASTDNVGVAGYKVYKNGTYLASVTSGTTYGSTDLLSGTSYSYTVSAFDAAGNLSAGSASVSATTQSSSDVEAPAVSITAPIADTVISGTITISATASDNVAVAGVQFKMDSTLLGTEDTVSPYGMSWDTGGVSNGSHTLTAVARDAAGNKKDSIGIIVTVSNTSVDTIAPSIPTGLAATAISSSQINLSWTASTDNVGVAGYKVYKNGTYLASVTSGTTYGSTDLLSGTSYSYTVSAFDAAGNLSAGSASASSFTTGTSTDTATTTHTDMTDTKTVTPVTFSVDVGTPRCKEGHTVATVFPSANPAVGGYFEIKNSLTSLVEMLESTSQPFRSGTYMWNGIPRSGYAVSGTASDRFTIPILDACSFSATTTDTATVQGNPHAHIALWQGDSNILSEQTLQGSVRVNIGVENAESVLIYSKTKDVSEPRLLGTAVRATDRPSLWRFLWDSTAVPDGNIFIFSRIKNASSDYAGDGIQVNIKNNTQSTTAVSPAIGATAPIYATNAISGSETTTHSVMPVIVALPEPKSYQEAEDLLGQKYREAENMFRKENKVPVGRLVSEEEKIKIAEEIHSQFSVLAPSADSVLLGTTTLSRTEEPSHSVAEITRVLATRNDTPALTDTDNDGISDYDETNIYGTDSNKPDTDTDGIKDGDEILAGTNPLQKVFVPIPRENPKDDVPGIITASQVLSVQKIEKIPAAKDTNNSKIASSRTLIHGTGPKNSFVMIYIFSTPVVVTVKTDSDGKWEYIMDKELEDGNHEIYLAMTESAGKILVKSPAIPFVKTAQAVTLSSDFALANTPVESPSGFFRGGTLALSLVVLFIILGLSFMIISFVSKKKESSDE